MKYHIQIKRNAQKALAKIPQSHQDRIINKIYTLAESPHPQGCKKLSGRPAWRIRVGNYRVLYEVHDNELIILVVQIGHRRDVYR